MNAPTLIPYLIPLAGVIGVVWLERPELSQLLRFRRESSRFELFALRADLVDLVVRGEMSEESLAWCKTYQALNGFLHLDNRLELRDVFFGMLKARITPPTNPDEWKALQRDIARQRKESEEFARILDALPNTLVKMAHHRTSRLGRLRLRIEVAGYLGVLVGVKLALDALLHGLDVLPRRLGKDSTSTGMVVFMAGRSRRLARG